MEGLGGGRPLGEEVMQGMAMAFHGEQRADGGRVQLAGSKECGCPASVLLSPEGQELEGGDGGGTLPPFAGEPPGGCNPQHACMPSPAASLLGRKSKDCAQRPMDIYSLIIESF